MLYFMRHTRDVVNMSNIGDVVFNMVDVSVHEGPDYISFPNFSLTVWVEGKRVGLWSRDGIDKVVFFPPSLRDMVDKGRRQKGLCFQKSGMSSCFISVPHQLFPCFISGILPAIADHVRTRVLSNVNTSRDACMGILKDKPGKEGAAEALGLARAHEASAKRRGNVDEFMAMPLCFFTGLHCRS